jgi:6-phosphogluconolactonase
MASTSSTLLIGTYTESLAHVDGKADGIHGAYHEDGRLSQPKVLTGMRNPSWVTSSADGRFVYAVAETVDFEGKPGGGIAAFSRDPGTEELNPVNTASSRGVEPGHLMVDPSGRFLLAINYRSGSVVVFGLRDDGGLADIVEQVHHEGSSAHPVRQTSPHPHQIVFDPVNGKVIVPDLGMDALFFYDLDESGQLTEDRSARFECAPGAGPRHVAFHPDNQYLFVLNELDNTLLVLKREDGRFVQNDLASTLPAGFKEHSQAAAVRVSPSGQHVFASNRGHDSIAVFEFDEATGKVTLKHLEPSRGSEPRDFVVTPDGSYLLVANQNSDNIVTFAIDESVSTFSHVDTFEVPTPVCLLFV